MSRVFLDIDVLEAARERMRLIFDEFEEVQVSVSSGKDSTVLLHLALQEAALRDRQVEVFFLDQEAEYDATVELIRHQMRLPNTIPLWYQVPIYMTNSTSYSDFFLYAWGEGEEWMREKEPDSIHEMDDPNYPRRFYEFFPYLEKQNTNKAYLVGLRAEEGIIRYRAVTKNPGYKDLFWSTETNGAYKFYPIFDWGWNDVWKFIYDYDLKYNKMYDNMFWANYSMYGMRVSNLIHEKSYKCLVDLPRFEPDTYDRLSKRIGGISTAARYATEKLIFSNKTLPSHYDSWLQFRDFLLENLPDPKHKEIFKERFKNQPENETIYQKQVGQLLINDWENSKPIDTKAEKRKEEVRNKWSKIL